MNVYILISTRSLPTVSNGVVRTYDAAYIFPSRPGVLCATQDTAVAVFERDRRSQSVKSCGTIAGQKTVRYTQTRRVHTYILSHRFRRNGPGRVLCRIFHYFFPFPSGPFSIYCARSTHVPVSAIGTNRFVGSRSEQQKQRRFPRNRNDLNNILRVPDYIIYNITFHNLNTERDFDITVDENVHLFVFTITC